MSWASRLSCATEVAKRAARESMVNVARAWTGEQAQRCLWRRPSTDRQAQHCGAKRQPTTDFDGPIDLERSVPKRDDHDRLLAQHLDAGQARRPAFEAGSERGANERLRRMRRIRVTSMLRMRAGLTMLNGSSYQPRTRRTYVMLNV